MFGLGKNTEQEDKPTSASILSDSACSGIAFTIEPETGFKDIIHISGCWGLGENIVQGNINPDEFYVFKPKFIEGKNAIVCKKLGTKAKTMVYSEDTDHSPEKNIVNIATPVEEQNKFVLNNKEINLIAQWSLIIEQHYEKAMDIEWAKDGLTGELFIVQARPETTHGNEDILKFNEYKLSSKGKILASGSAVGSKIASGIARVLNSVKESDKLKEGEILVADMTNPDWDPLMKKASAIVTNKGGRTSHASIVAREIGIVAVVGTGDGTTKISDVQQITVSCSEGEVGNVYEGKLEWKKREIINKKY